MASVNIIGPSGAGKDTFNSNRELQNWYFENTTFGRYQWILQPTPGLTAFATCPFGLEIRALLNYNNSLYGVCDNFFFSVDQNGNFTNLGTMIIPVENPNPLVNMKAISGQIMIVDGYNGYIWNLTTSTFSQITDPSFPAGCKTLVSAGDQFVVEGPNSQQFWWSNLGDGTTWNGLQFASAETLTDNLVAVYFTGQFLFLLGLFATEIWQDVGGTDVFDPIPGTFIDYGVISPYCICQVENSLFWVTQNRYGDTIVLQTIDFDTHIISSPAMSYQLSQYPTLTDCFSYTFQQFGHQFVIFTFPSGNTTWMYDMSSQMWSKWLSKDGNTDGRHISNCYAFCYSHHIVGGYNSPTLYYIDSNNYTDSGNRIRRMIRFPFPVDGNKRTTIHQLQVDSERGQGLSTGQGSNPQIAFRFSKDGGHTWGNQRLRSFGQQGQYNQRCKWMTVGHGDLPFGELVFTDPVYCPIYGGTAIISSEDNGQ